MAPKKKGDEAVAEPAPPWADEGLEVVKESGVRGVIASKEPWQIQWEDGTLDNPVLVWAGTVQAAPAWAAKGVKVCKEGEPGVLGWIVSTQPWQIKWQDGSTKAVVSWTGLAMVPKMSGHFVLLTLDPLMSINRTVLQELCAYVKAFFGRELKIVDVPVTPIAPDCPPGWEALKERCQTCLQSKPGRDGAVAPRQLLSSQLLHCLQLVQEDPGRYGIDTDGAEWVLGITLNEFYHDPSGLRPDEPVPEERTKDFFIRKNRVGVCSVAQLEFCGPAPQFTSSLNPRAGSQRLPRQIFELVTNSLLALLGLRTCSSHQCCAYMKPFALNVTPLQMCFNCEEMLLKKLYPGSTDALVKSALARYSEIAEVLTNVSDRLPLARLGKRRYKSFEEEIDWMQIAVEVLNEISAERFCFTGTEGPQNRRRSLRVCLREVHERQSGRTLHRMHSEPLVKRTCLLDMMKSAPFRHESGELNKWTTLKWNKAHTWGGHYVESGGSLRPKTLGTFVESGLNASLVHKIAKGQLPKNLEDLSDHKLATICGQHRLGEMSTRAEQLKAVENIATRQSMRENRLNKRQFYGTDLWRKTASSVNPEAANGEIPPRGGDPQAKTEDWRPRRSRRNAHSMTYTAFPTFAATG